MIYLPTTKEIFSVDPHPNPLTKGEREVWTIYAVLAFAEQTL